MCRQNHCCAVDYFAIGVIGYEFMLGRVSLRNSYNLSDLIMGRQEKTLEITFLQNKFRSVVMKSLMGGQLRPLTLLTNVFNGNPQIVLA